MLKSIFYDRSKNRYYERWQENGQEKTYYLPEGIDYSEIRRMRKIQAKGVLWDDWVELDLNNYSAQVRGSTVLKLEGLYRRITEMFQPELLLDVSYELMLEYRNRRIESGIQASTFNSELTVLKAALYRAVDLGYIKDNPVASRAASRSLRASCKAPLKLSVDEKPVRVISESEFEKLLSACPTDHWRLILYLGYYAGLRIGEILGLRPCDIDMEKRIIYVYSYKDKRWRTKTGNGREVRIFDTLYRYLQGCDLSGEFVVKDISARGNMTQRCSDQASTRFGIICRSAGLVDNIGWNLFTLHDLRKSCISRWKRAGFDLCWVQQMAGHKNLMTTVRHYVEPVSMAEFARLQESRISELDWEKL